MNFMFVWFYLYESLLILRFPRREASLCFSHTGKKPCSPLNFISIPCISLSQSQKKSSCWRTQSHIFFPSELNLASVNVKVGVHLLLPSEWSQSNPWRSFHMWRCSPCGAGRHCRRDLFSSLPPTPPTPTPATWPKNSESAQHVTGEHRAQWEAHLKYTFANHNSAFEESVQEMKLKYCQQRKKQRSYQWKCPICTTSPFLQVNLHSLEVKLRHLTYKFP